MVQLATRNIGADVLQSVPWGTHFCQFYKTKEDMLDLLVPYFKAGLENQMAWVCVYSLI